MKNKFCTIRINVTKYDVTFATKEGFYPHPQPCGYVTGRKTLYCKKIQKVFLKTMQQISLVLMFISSQISVIYVG